MLGELREENQRLRADMAQCRDSEAAAKQEASELRKQVKDWDPDPQNLIHLKYVYSALAHKFRRTV